MRPPPFEFTRPSTVGDAILAITEPEEGMFYSGGTELLLAMKLRVIHTGRLIDIKGIPGLDKITLIDQDSIEIGARCTHKKIANSEITQQYVPALSRLCANVANIRVRSTGTIGGNLCFGEPHADPPTMLAALGARLWLVGPNGERLVQADEFIRHELETVREPDELLTHIVVPMPTGPVTYIRFRHGERPSVNVAMVWALEHQSGTITSARIRVGALGPRPQALEQVESALRGVAVVDASRLVEDALPAALDELDVTDDRHGSAEYKRHIAGVLLRRSAAEALAEWGERQQ
jgi:aerobic carbon-monoxide dehydrogenase medium subunit